MEDPIRGLAEAWEAEVNEVEKERDYWREEARQTRFLLEAAHRRIDDFYK